MKIAELLAILLLTLTFNAIHAADELAAGDVDATAYCEDQLQLAGIEDVNEMEQYMQECVYSLEVSEGAAPSTNQ